MAKRSLIYLILRIGVAFVFIFPAVSAFSSPATWIGYMPEFISSLPVDQISVLKIIGGLQIILALWILSGRQIFIPSVLASCFLIMLLGFNAHEFEILFRDVAVFAMTLSLAIWSYDADHKLWGSKWTGV